MQTCWSVRAGLITPVGRRSVRKDKEAPRAGREKGSLDRKASPGPGPHPHRSEIPNLLVEGRWGFAELRAKRSQLRGSTSVLEVGSNQPESRIGTFWIPGLCSWRAGLGVGGGGGGVSPGPTPLWPSPRRPGRSLLSFPTGSFWWLPTLSAPPGWGHRGGSGRGLRQTMEGLAIPKPPPLPEREDTRPTPPLFCLPATRLALPTSHGLLSQNVSISLRAGSLRRPRPTARDLREGERTWGS